MKDHAKSQRSAPLVSVVEGRTRTGAALVRLLCAARCMRRRPAHVKAL
jgi:hypothetical protein